MASLRKPTRSLWGAAATLVLVACGSGRDAPPPAGLDAGVAQLLADDAGNAFAHCATDHLEAHPVPLDVLVMLDASESMLGPALGGTKWTAVTDALGAFARGQGVGGAHDVALALSFFPVTHPSVPATCTVDAQCGAYGPCGTKACRAAPSDGLLRPCQSNADCPGGVACATLGVCSQNLAFLCTDVGGSCGGALGACIASTGSTCAELHSCKTDDYRTTAVAFTSLGAGGAVGPFVAALQARRPAGDTPTAAALEGALAEARARHALHPERKAVVILATDGLPTRCYPTDGEAIGRLAARAATEVSTFVVGVFASGDDQGRRTADAIARGGGTDHALVIDEGADVAVKVREALDTIRGASVGCELTIPTPRDQEPDFRKLNLELSTAKGGRRVVPYVGSAAACDPAAGGWHYDVDPDQGRPRRVVLCERSCRAVHDDAPASVDLFLGCASVLR